MHGPGGNGFNNFGTICEVCEERHGIDVEDDVDATDRVGGTEEEIRAADGSVDAESDDFELGAADDGVDSKRGKSEAQQFVFGILGANRPVLSDFVFDIGGARLKARGLENNGGARLNATGAVPNANLGATLGTDVDVPTEGAATVGGVGKVTMMFEASEN